MMHITLQPITADTWQECAELEPGDEQRDFVASPLYTIAEAQFYPTMKARAVVDERDTIVGIVFYGWSPPSSRHKIVRLLIDRRYQGRGYGRAAMQAVLDDLRADGDAREVWLSYREHNSAARRLYLSLGFREHAIEENGRITASLRFAEQPGRGPGG